MYFNRKNAEQKNWRMIKKGKHFLFGCSLVFAVGASLATQVVHANTAETTVANNSTTGDVNPTPNGDGKTYEAPAAVAEIKPEVATTPAVAAKLDGETAKEVKALDKTKLENYIAEIEAKLANGTYESKTEESVAVLKADLEAAKATLANATTQDEITKAYSKLVTTVNTKLKAKPVEKKETPAVDTTNGQPTVGKKAENTEKKSESNSIENTGSNDPRNGKALDKNNAFRAEVAYSGNTNENSNGHSDTYILNDVGRRTSPSEAAAVVSKVTNYKVKYNKDANGKITSLDWLVFFNDHSENLANTYQTDGGELYRNYIQIPAEVNMPTSITRAQYASPRNGKLNPVTRRLEREKPNGQPVSASSTFENPTPDRASGLPREGLDTFSINDWPNAGKGRALENLGSSNLSRYFGSAATNGSPKTQEILRAASVNGERVLSDRATTGGSSYNSYVWSFRTTVPGTTTNEQLKDMKVVFGMMRSATAGANAAFVNVASNPVNLSNSDIATNLSKPGINNTYTQTNDTITMPTVASTDTTLSGTGKPGAIVNIKKNGKVAKQTQVAGNGQWSIPLDFGLNSNVTGGSQFVPADKISVSQTVNGIESGDTDVNVSLGHSEILPSSKSKQQNNLVANDRNVTLKVPHDAGAAYFQFTDADGNAREVGLKRDAVPGKWQVNSSSSALASVTSSEDGKFYSTINLALNKDMKAGSTAKVISNMQEGSYSSLQGWQPRNVEEAPKEETPAPETPKPQPETPKPSAPAGDATTSGPEIVNDLAGKASTPADVTIKAPAGSTVKLYNKDGVVIGEAVANDQGVATIHPTNSLPEGEITATSTPAGGKESAKSAPITVTKTPLTIIDGGVTGNNDTRLLVSKETITVYPGDNIDINVVAQATALEKFSVEQNAIAIKGVLPSGGYLGSSNGATINQRDAKYSGTVAMDQPAGTTSVIFHASNRDKPTKIYRELKVIVLETAKKYEPVAGTKVDVADSNGVSETEKNKIIEAVKTANPSLPAESQYSVDEKGNLTITYPDGSKDKIAAAYLVNPAPSDADKNTPTAKPQTVNKGTTPKAEDSIGNVKDLPKGTKVAFKDPVDTATPGEKAATVVVTYPDGSKEEVPVKVTVKAPSDAEDPTTKDTDGDGLTDKEEADKGTDPKKADTDGDGLTDKEEADKGTDPKKADTDGDGLTDKEEADKGTDPKKADTDGDGFTDKEEVAKGTDPKNPNSKPESKPEDPSTKDTDGDGLTDKEEADKGTDPKKADTDGDGLTDKEEADKGTDPKNPNSKPESPAKPAVTPIVDPSNLTEAEKAKVADEVKKSNPTVTDVKVGKDGTTTVTFPDGSTAVIPSGDTVKKSSDNAVKDPAVTPVVDPSNLTEAEKAKVADEVKKSNPTVTDVKVGKDGTTTVTFPDGTIAVIPSAKAVKKSSANAVKDPAVTRVVDPSNLTEAEKAKVAEAVKKSNPTVTDVKVGKDGTTTVTFPDGTTAVIPSGDTVKKSNPTAKDVNVGKGGTTAVIPANKADDKSKDADGVKDPSVTLVVDPSNLTEAEKAKVAEAVKKSNPTVTDVKVGKDGTTTVTFPDGTTAVIPADKAVTSAEQDSHAVVPAGKAVTSAEQGSHAATPAKKAGAKELPNTGTADSTVAMVAAAASALLGLGLAGRRRKEDEEA